MQPTVHELPAVLLSIAGKLSLGVFPLLMIIAGVDDVMRLRIPNRLVLWIAVLFFVCAAATRMPLDVMVMHLATGGLILASGIFIYKWNLFGAGDAKLAAAAGLWLGYPGAVMFLMFAAVAGGVSAVCIGLLFVAHLEAELKHERLGRWLGRAAPNVPYGYALAAGAILALPWSWWFVFAT